MRIRGGAPGGGGALSSNRVSQAVFFGFQFA
ncbi:hypothetical protein SMF913_14853 [Streptomyces malaysiensis]|uniref:Uncharacterized protein n=1 Tax=Streptomyces malaysiensis TaxID=92644 RepID=A0A2J7ZF01_STRMQ|nr:hypothetical protein SMF913_14853 [Streptomyces malaysiensis]